MTTATARSTAATALAGLVVALLGFVVGGPAAGLGAGLGAVVVTVVLAFGALVVAAVVRLAPQTSLFVGLSTYTFSLVVVTVALGAVSAALPASPASAWCAYAVIGCALAWTVVQVRGWLTSRVLYFDPTDGPDVPQTASLSGATGVERGAS